MMNVMEHMFDPIIDWLSVVSLPILGVILVAIIAEYIGEKLIKIAIHRSIHGKHFGRPKQPLADVKKRQKTIIGITIIFWKVLVFLGAGLGIFKIVFPQVDLLPIFASAGVLGAVIGFGAQSIIKDIIAGIFIIAENQFRVGDVVEIDAGGVGSGTVEHISLRSTVLRDVSGNVHYVSNGNIVHVINKTMGYSKVNFAISVKPNTDIDVLAEIIEKVGTTLAESEKWKHKIIEAPHFVNLGAFSDTALEVNISGTTQPGEQWAVTSEMKKRLLTALKKYPEVKLAHYMDLSALGPKK